MPRPRTSPNPAPFGVVDLFSGAGGMSCGFHRHPLFRLMAAADAEIGKPNTGRGTLQCNATYERNMGLKPHPLDLAAVEAASLRKALRLGSDRVQSATAAAQGFPNDFIFEGRSLSNSYRHIGDAVPPLISWQLASVCAWILTGKRPAPAEFVMPGTHLRTRDVVETR